MSAKTLHQEQDEEEARVEVKRPTNQARVLPPEEHTQTQYDRIRQETSSTGEYTNELSREMPTDTATPRVDSP